jgi:hypothetical protein
VPADLADNAAATTEGWQRVQYDRGVTAVPRYVTRYEKPYDGDMQSGGLHVVVGDDSASQANADTRALNALNGYRRYLYGTDATNVNKGNRSNATLTVGRH